LLVSFEHRSGKAYDWHVKRVMIRAEDVMEEIAGEDRKGRLGRLNKALPPFAEAVEAFDAYRKGPRGMDGALGSHPQRFLQDLKAYRDASTKKSAKANTLLFGLIKDYNAMVEMAVWMQSDASLGARLK